MVMAYASFDKLGACVSGVRPIVLPDKAGRATGFKTTIIGMIGSSMGAALRREFSLKSTLSQFETTTDGGSCVPKMRVGVFSELDACHR